MADPARALRKNCASWADLVELRRSLEALASRIDRELDPITRALAGGPGTRGGGKSSPHSVGYT